MDGLAAESFGVYAAAVSVTAVMARGEEGLTQRSLSEAHREHREEYWCELALAKLFDPAG